MKRHSTKKPRQKICLFCENTASTEEHYFSDWLDRLYPQENVFGVSHQVDRFEEENGRYIANGNFSRFSRVLSSRENVLCGTCNNEWGSHIDNKMKSAFMDIFYQPDINISASQSEDIARWILLKYFLFESQEEMPIINKALSLRARNYANKCRKSDAKSRRHLFRKTNNPFENFCFFISRNSSFDPPFAANFTTAELYYENDAGIGMSVNRAFRLFVGPMQAVCTNDMALANYINTSSANDIVQIYEMKRNEKVIISTEEMNFHSFDYFIVQFLRERYGESYRSSFIYKDL